MSQTPIDEAGSRAPQSQQSMSVPKPTSPGAIGGTVTVNINGQDVKVPLGTTILEAAQKIGIRIPHPLPPP